MKAIRHVARPGFLLVGILSAILGSSCKERSEPPPPANELPPEIKSFAAAKEKQTRELEAQLHLQLSPEIWTFFDAAKNGHVAEALRIQAGLRRRAGQYEGSPSDPGVATPAWGPVLETTLALEAFAPGEPKYVLAFGRDIIASIPPGSIYSDVNLEPQNRSLSKLLQQLQRTTGNQPPPR